MGGMMTESPIEKSSRNQKEESAIEQETKEIIRRVKSGDKVAFSGLVRLYKNQVASLAYKVAGDYDEAADITQDVFIKVSKNIWRYNESKKFYTWLYRITTNASIDYIRKHHRHQHESIENIQEKADDNLITPDISYQLNRIIKFINEAADLLNEKQKSTFVLRDMEGCNINDVAGIMNIPEATVRWYLHRARTKIKKELLKKCPQLLFGMGFR
jgi:RNA polymerase sigma-70 factor (ECF subfamily)